MSDDKDTSQIDVIGTTGGKATVSTKQSTRGEFGEWLLSSRDHHRREDAVLGEVVRICMRLDKAGFAKLYAVAKAEEAAMDARLDRDIEGWRESRNEDKP
jgi:hypothetical protein